MLYFYFLPILLFKTSWYWRGLETVDLPALFTGLGIKHWAYFINYDVNRRVFVDAFYQVKEVPLYSQFAENFCKTNVDFFWMPFLQLIGSCVFFLRMLSWWITWLCFKHEPDLPSLNKPHLVVEYYSSYVLLDFYIYVRKK